MYDPLATEECSQQLEARVAALETELAQIKQLLRSGTQKKASWWEQIAGSLENDPNFDEAVRFGREWRGSAE